MNTKQAIKNVSIVPDKLDLSGGTVTGETVFNNYLSVNAWPGYGTGKSQIWFNGNTKSLVLQPSTTDIVIGTNRVYHEGNKPSPADIGAAPAHGHDYIGPAGYWRTNGGQDLLVWDKRALVGMSNGQLHLGYGGDFTDIRCGNGYTVWHSGNFDPNSKISTSASCNRNWNWSGKGGQPTWLWGGEDGTNMYVYNPSNFSVNYANSAWNASRIEGRTIFVQQSQPSPNATGDIWISW